MISSNEPLLYPLLLEQTEVASEKRKRKNQFDYQKVHPKLVEEAEEDGWSFSKRLKNSVRMKKLKPVDERLENKFWCLLQDLGFPILNEGRRFKIRYKRKENGKVEEKQVDVFAKDDETVVIAECKASAKLTQKRTLQKDIEEFANLQKKFADSIRGHFGSDFKPKILWLFVTENIVWSKPDQLRADGENIQVITEQEMLYLRQLADHLGSAARFQFLAEYFAGQSIPELMDKTVPATRGQIGDETFYSFVVAADDLLKISFVNHRSLKDPDGMPTYQRLVSKPRIKEIAKFIEEDGYFPTNILINLKKEPRFDLIKAERRSGTSYGYLYLPDFYKAAWIIDGQHRLYGYAHADEKFRKQPIFVLAFDRMSQLDEANTFVTINSKQKSVPANLLAELDGDLKWGSKKPNEIVSSTAARCISCLHGDLGGPIYARVVSTGIKRTERLCLTTKGLKDGIRLSGLIGRAIQKNKIYEHGPLSGSTQPITLSRANEFVSSYLRIIRESNYVRWDRGQPGNLCTNVGISGLLRLAGSLIKYVEIKEHKDAKEMTPIQILIEIGPYLEPLLTFLSESADSEVDKYLKVQFGSGGPNKYYFRLVDIIAAEFPEFKPAGYEEEKTKRAKEQIQAADQRVNIIRAIIVGYLFGTIKAAHPDGNHFEKGVKDNELKKKAYNNSLGDELEVRAPLENYLDILDYKKIAETAENWPKVQAVFNLPPAGEDKGKQHTSWFAKYNTGRNRGAAHSTLERNYTTDDLVLFEQIERDLYSNLQRSAGKGDEVAKQVITKVSPLVSGV